MPQNDPNAYRNMTGQLMLRLAKVLEQAGVSLDDIQDVNQLIQEVLEEALAGESVPETDSEENQNLGAAIDSIPLR